MDTPQLDLLQQPTVQTRQNQLLKVLKQIQLLILLLAQGVAVLMVRNGHIFINIIFQYVKLYKK